MYKHESTAVYIYTKEYENTDEDTVVQCHVYLCLPIKVLQRALKIPRKGRIWRKKKAAPTDKEGKKNRTNSEISGQLQAIVTFHYLFLFLYCILLCNPSSFCGFKLLFSRFEIEKEFVTEREWDHFIYIYIIICLFSYLWLWFVELLQSWFLKKCDFCHFEFKRRDGAMRIRFPSLSSFWCCSSKSKSGSWKKLWKLCWLDEENRDLSRWFELDGWCSEKFPASLLIGDWSQSSDLWTFHCICSPKVEFASNGTGGGLD